MVCVILGWPFGEWGMGIKFHKISVDNKHENKDGILVERYRKLGKYIVSFGRH